MVGAGVAAVEAGISSAAVAAEGAVTAGATVAESAAVGVAQAGAAAAEGAVQTAGAATETAVEAIPAATEAVPGAVSAGAEGAAQEGLAASTETIIKTPGSEDEAFSHLKNMEAWNEVNKPPEVARDPAGPSQTGEKAPEQSANDEKESLLPKKVASDSRFREIFGEEYAGAKQRGEDVDISKIDQVASDRYYAEKAAKQIAQGGLSDEIRNDPDFKKIFEEEKLAVSEKGEEVSEEDLDKRALAKFNQEKDKQAEQSQLTPEQQQILQLNKAVIELKEIVESLTKKMVEKEQDPKKKETLLALLAKIAAIVVVSAVMEGGKNATSPLSSPGR